MIWGAMVYLNSSVAQEPVRDEAIKAAFLYRFTNYTQWPADDEGTFAIAVLGPSPVAEELAKIVRNHPVHSLPTSVLRYSKLDRVARPQILYISAEYAGDVKAAIHSFANQPVLVVTDRTDGLEAGSTINFLTADRRVRFEVSVPAARRSGISLSPELLSVAVRVITAAMRSNAPCGESHAEHTNQSCVQLLATM